MSALRLGMKSVYVDAGSEHIGAARPDGSWRNSPGASEWRMNNPGGAETAALVAGLLVGFVDIRSVWSMDHEPVGTDVPRERTRLLVFGDSATLHRLHSGPHAPNVEVFVVTDGDAVQSAWDARQGHGSLTCWAWCQTSASEAFYDEARWTEDGTAVVRVRRKAQLVWQTPPKQNNSAFTSECGYKD